MNEDQNVCFGGGSEKSSFEWLPKAKSRFKMLLNFSYEEEFTQFLL